MIGIYKITNTINNKCFIGQFIQIGRRGNNRRITLTKINDICYNYPLYQALRKYGLRNFTFEVLEECSQEELNIREQYWINFYDSYKNGYNPKENNY